MGRKIGYRYRCSRQACRTRRTLPRRLEQYVREPRCRCCGGSLTLDVYRQRKGASEGRPTCYCDGVHYPHREGGTVWCRHHPTGPTDRDFIERYGRNCMEAAHA